jgi:Bax protein
MFKNTPKLLLKSTLSISLMAIVACGDAVSTESLPATKQAAMQTEEVCSVYVAKSIPAYSKTMTVQSKKQRFKDIVLPAVDTVFCELTAQYQEIEAAIAAGDTSAYDSLKKSYKVKTDQELLMAVKPHPKSIAMAQAAMESAWATSRFTREANNLFGVWSFNKNEPRIAAGEKRGSKTIWLKKYASVEESVRDYYKTLARSSAFGEFRETKMKTNDPHVLVTKLDSYSEKKEVYGEELSGIIRFNKYFELDVEG